MGGDTYTLWEYFYDESGILYKVRLHIYVRTHEEWGLVVIFLLVYV